LNMGTRAGVCRLAGETRKRLVTDRALRRAIEARSKNAILNVKWLTPLASPPRTLTIKVRASSVHDICRFFTVC
ncbi:MAG: hypothetical protein WBX20_06475, partial [Terrimicrobiaceae bacterium]